MPLSTFHPAVSTWFGNRFGQPSPVQAAAWPAIAAGGHTLLSAPTGSGKTLAAFLAAIDTLVREGLEGPLPDGTSVVYVSPLKALSNDIRINLEAPLMGIADSLLESGLPAVGIRTAVRTKAGGASGRVRIQSIDTGCHSPSPGFGSDNADSMGGGHQSLPSRLNDSSSMAPTSPSSSINASSSLISPMANAVCLLRSVQVNTNFSRAATFLCPTNGSSRIVSTNHGTNVFCA